MACSLAGPWRVRYAVEVEKTRSESRGAEESKEQEIRDQRSEQDKERVDEDGRDWNGELVDGRK